MKCGNPACGHGRSWHRASATAIRTRRKRGDRRPALPACWFGAVAAGHKVCPAGGSDEPE